MKVFISSTYIDLIPHRKELWNLLHNLSLHVIGMETFGARKDKPLDTCLNEVKESDIVIFIIGMRYGSIDLNENKSYTELEYKQAIKSKKNIFVYLIDEYKAFVHPKNIDFENQQKLQSFKNQLKKKHTVDFFETEKDLVRKININLKRNFKLENSNFKRPKSVDCTITKFKISNEEWIVIIGYFYGQPVESYIFHTENFFNVPNYIKKGKIIKRYVNNEVFYDLQYINNKGYRVTSEGISHSTRMSTGKLNKVIDELFKNSTSIESIIKIIPNLTIENIKNMNSLKKGLKKALMLK